MTPDTGIRISSHGAAIIALQIAPLLTAFKNGEVSLEKAVAQIVTEVSGVLNEEPEALDYRTARKAEQA